ncbi:MAG: elongation factor P maturation arginine rhamnosyltransferase EarP [Pseudomonadota bacterium]|jgi:uncharacterized repeat protein (TIGR03837 family)
MSLVDHSRARRWDIFCAVVDNYGDIGVTWRLARQLAAEHGLRVRLWVDDPHSLVRLYPGVDAVAMAQTRQGVELRRWLRPFPEQEAHDVGDVVVEAFACELPAAYLNAMAARKPQPCWINLEYLSAEDWVAGCHGLTSPHPRLPLTKRFFFPGFTTATGGLLRERDLLARRDRFRGDDRARAALWQFLGVPEPAPQQFTISLFGYENPALGGLLAAWSEGGEDILCLVPEGRLLGDVSAFFGATAEVGVSFRRGRLELRVIPFVDQDAYDRLLWVCDLNFVRGEDSFVRAQWAGRPLVWHIYPQEQDAHWPKLRAFEDLYCAGLAPAAARALADFWEAWNRGEGAGAAWAGFRAHRAGLEAHAADWARRLARQEDLAAALVRACDSPV